ncbi:MAG TPA: hypothetical protein VIA19_05240 [Burkholderiales bacterium]
MVCPRFSIAGFMVTALLGCGGDASVAICWGDAAFCSAAFSSPDADAGPDQAVASGSLVTLDGSRSQGGVDAFSWAQTGGPAVALVNANNAVAMFNAPFVANATTLTFQLTVVDKTQHADTDATSVTVRP